VVGVDVPREKKRREVDAAPIPGCGFSTPALGLFFLNSVHTSAVYVVSQLNIYRWSPRILRVNEGKTTETNRLQMFLLICMYKSDFMTL
jgi:hypothetical protein